MNSDLEDMKEAFKQILKHSRKNGFNDLSDVCMSVLIGIDGLDPKYDKVTKNDLSLADDIKDAYDIVHRLFHSHPDYAMVFALDLSIASHAFYHYEGI